MFYTNFQQVGNNVLLAGVKDGKRFLEKIKYKPYVFIKSAKESKYKTLEGEKVSKISFESMAEARNFYRSHGDISNMDIFGLEKFMYVCMSDMFEGKKVPYDRSKIVEWFLDIETIGDGSFPDIETANQEVVAVTIRINETRWVFGLKDFNTTDKDILYVKFPNEEALLQALVQFFKSPIHRPDVITGWYIEFFDIPYLVNRIRRILGEDAAKSISPWGILNEREVIIRGKMYTIYMPLGISILDYISLYKKFTQNEKEQYSLDYISQEELGVGKLDYSAYDGLTDLYERNPQMFIEYNIIDVDRVFQIDQKLKFLNRVYAIAYDAKVNYNDALGSVLLWDILIHNDLKKYNIVVPPMKKMDNDRKIPGGYVKEPIPSMYNWVLSFDLTSLYPHLIIQHNISPETFIRREDVNTFDSETGRLYEYDLVADAINGIRVNEDYSIAANGCLYRKDKQGFLGRLMEEQFEQRVEIKKQLKIAQKKFNENPTKELEDEIAMLDAAQWSQKIKINSAYGAVANEWFRYFSFENASAITTSGQMAAKMIGKQLNAVMNQFCETTGVDYIIASDTDSVYINCEALVTKMGLVDKKKIVDFLDAFGSKKIEPFIKKCFDQHAAKMNAFKSALSMKREAIAERAAWRAKKNYIMTVWDSEGIRFEKPVLKAKGVETERSSTPKICREHLKKAYEILMYGSEPDMINFIDKFKEVFYTLSFEDIAKPSSVSELSKYIDGRTGSHRKGAPMHVKAALVYNDAIVKNKLHKKYPLISDKDKIKFCEMIMPNPVFSPVFGISKEFPTELGLAKYIDYKQQFEKTFLSPIKSFLDIVGWKTEHVNTLEQFE